MKKKYDEDKLAKTFMPAVIRRYRDAAGLSQQELADRVGISKSYISSLELGYRAPSLNLLVKIAQTLEVNAGKMVDEMVEDAESRWFHDGLGYNGMRPGVREYLFRDYIGRRTCRDTARKTVIF